MDNIKLNEEQGEVVFGTERYPIKEEQIVAHKAKVEALQNNLQEIKKRWLDSPNDEKLY